MIIENMPHVVESNIGEYNNKLDTIVDVKMTLREMLVLGGILNKGDETEHIETFIQYLISANGYDWCNEIFNLGCSCVDSFTSFTADYTDEILNKLKIEDDMLYDIWHEIDDCLTSSGVVFR